LNTKRLLEITSEKELVINKMDLVLREIFGLQTTLKEKYLEYHSLLGQNNDWDKKAVECFEGEGQ